MIFFVCIYVGKKLICPGIFATNVGPLVQNNTFVVVVVVYGEGKLDPITLNIFM